MRLPCEPSCLRGGPFAAAFTAAALLIVPNGSAARAQDSVSQAQSAVERQSEDPAAAIVAADAVDVAVERGIDYLVSQQTENGSVRDRGHETAMTALAVMALASVGVQPSDPTPRGRAMRKALNYILDERRIDKSGYFGHSDNSRMYGHGIITLMLTEMLGMGADAEQDALIRTRCEAAIKLILDSQAVRKPAASRGGWRYTPDARDADLSVSVWQLMALRSARNDGMDVPASAIADAVAYLRRSYASPSGRDGRPDNPKSGFCYEPTGNNPTFTMTAAGLLAMQVCGEYDAPRVVGASDWLMERPPRWDDRFACYGIYYYAQGMHQRGGAYAAEAAGRVRTLLLEEQLEDGSWSAANGSERGIGHVYATSLAVLSLSVKYHYLPIYQR